MDTLHTYLPTEIRKSIASIGGAKAAWARFDHSVDASSHSELAVITGEGRGRVVGVRIVEVAGKTIKQWLTHERADQLDLQQPDWQIGRIPEQIDGLFAHLKQILRHPELPNLTPSHLLHQSPPILIA